MVTDMTQSRFRSNNNSAMAQALKRADRVLSGHRGVSVALSVHSANPRHTASTQDGRIQINVKANDVRDVKTMVLVLGLNYHEVGHILFTPTNKTTATPHHPFNILEDQRMESMMVAVYPSLVEYFRYTCAEMLRETREKEPDLVYALVYGRRYLKKNIRRAARKLMVKKHGESFTRQIERIIDTYRMMNLGRMMTEEHRDRVELLVQEFHALLNKDSPARLENPHGSGNSAQSTGSANAPFMSKEDNRLNKEANELLKEGADEADDDPDDEELSEGGADGSDDDAEAGDAGDAEDGDDDEAGQDDQDDTENGGSGDQSSDDDTDGSGDSGGDSGDTDDGDDTEGDADNDGRGSGDGSGDSDQGDDSADDTSSGGNGAGAGTRDDITETFPELTDELSDLIDNILDSALSDSGIRNDVADWKKTIDHADAEVDRQYNGSLATGALIGAARKFSEAISGAIREDVDPGWEHDHASGRVNMQKVMQGAPYDEVFDRWYEGHNDAFNIDAIVALDTSSSMSREIYGVSQAAWVLRAGIESLPNGHCATIAWGPGIALWLYPEGNQGVKVVYPGASGGTHAVPMLEKAIVRFSAEHRKKNNRVLFILSDGGWLDMQEAIPLVDQLHQMGVLIVMVNLSTYQLNTMVYADARVLINNGTDLAQVAQATITALFDQIGKGLVGRR